MKTEILITVEHPAEAEPWTLIGLAITDNIPYTNQCLAPKWHMSYRQVHVERTLNLLDDIVDEIRNDCEFNETYEDIAIRLGDVVNAVKKMIG